jgi:hypothetical protein
VFFAMKRYFPVERNWLALFLLASLWNIPLTGAEPVRRFSVEVDLGEDLGQSFGSLLEVVDSEGDVVAGAGFTDVYNTRFRGDRHTIQFFVRDAGQRDRFTVERLPHPDLDLGIYLLDVDQELRAWSSVRGNSVRRWEAGGKQWKSEGDGSRLRSGDGVIRVGHGILRFIGGGATYDDRPILQPAKVGAYYNFYYAAGQLMFYHRHRVEVGGFTRILACPWKPGQQGLIDVSTAIAIEAKYVGATPFAWGQYQGQVLTVSNYGGVYVFQEGAWRVLLEGNDQVSYQVYSILNFHDRLYLAQYPTGHLFEYDGQELTHRDNWPPRLPGVSSSAREAQTMAIYGGDLMVGVWPWAELWRYQHESGSWHSMGRMFSHPELTAEQTHPYEQEANRLGLVTNHWGQRITGMVPLGADLMLSTSAKGTYDWKPSYDFLTDKQRRQYGAVLKLNRPGCLAARITWTGKPLRLEFRITAEALEIIQDGTLIGKAPYDMPPDSLAGELKLRVGQGAYGKLQGRILSQQVK